MIDFKTTKEESRLIGEICKRFMDECGKGEYAYLDVEMDITACHLNGCPLKLQELLVAEDSDFFHDVHGIHRHLNRKTGEIEDFFLPRYSK